MTVFNRALTVFDRVSLHLGMASIIKNYTEHEQFTMNFSTSFKNLEMMRGIGEYVSPEVSVLNGLVNYMRNIHIDFDEGIPHIYDVPHCAIIELRGDEDTCSLSRRLMHHLLMDVFDAVVQCEEWSILQEMFTTYTKHMTAHPRCAYVLDIVSFIHWKLEEGLEESDLASYIDGLDQTEDYKTNCRNDVEFLQRVCHPDEKFYVE